MKKYFIKIITIIFILLANCGCTNKSVLSTTAFSSVLKSHDFEIIDITNQYSKEPNIDKVYIGKNKDKYQIEYFIILNEETAKTIFNENIKAYNNLSGTTKTKVEGNNFIKYTFLTNSYYVVISKVENTFIYIEAPIDYKNEIDIILEEMNY